jgi:hypothetical protein
MHKVEQKTDNAQDKYSISRYFDKLLLRPKRAKKQPALFKVIE